MPPPFFATINHALMNTKLSLFPTVLPDAFIEKELLGERARTLRLFIHIANKLSKKVVAIYIKIVKLKNIFASWSSLTSEATALLEGWRSLP